MATSETLRSVIDAGKSSKRLDELSTARVIGKIAEQLHAAQQKAGSGKSVGPITPAAITIDPGGAVKIDLTQRGSALGYSAPEIVEGSSGDRRSDVFSLGVVMWEALTHQRLFEAMNDSAVKLAVKEREIKPPMELNANIPAELSSMCMKALARDPAERYQSAKVMSVEIDEFLSEAGYEDSAAPLVGFLADMKKAPKPTLLPPSILKPLPPEPEPEKKVSDSTKPLPSGLALASALAKAETKPVEAVAPAPVAAVPDAPKLPDAAAPKHELPKPRSAPVIVPKADVAATPSPIASSLPPIDSVGSFAPAVEAPRTPPKATISAVVPPPPATPTVPDLPKPAEAPKVEAAVAVEAAPEKVTSTGSQPTKLPQAADAVSLPKRAHRDSENVLANWAWQTDTHEPIIDEHEDFHPPPSKKPLYYVIGGGVALATIVTIIAIGFGGSKTDKKPAQQTAQPNAQTQEATAPAPTPAPAPAPEPAKPEVATAPAPAPEPAPPPPAPEPPKQEAQPTPPPPAPEPPKQEPPPAPPPPKAEPKVAKAEPPKPPPKVEKKAPPPAPKIEPKPKTIAKAEPKTETKKGDASSVEASYRMGLQLFARGDTQGALASLRTSLAGNPNYAPTWRGLGLVFEKMGEKDQARAAYKRYLQLSPNAGDAEQIRSRMERLGS